jgi:uncharacterized protein (TIGR02594 family)
MNNIKEIQTRLKVHGFVTGPVDGKLGPLTSSAIVAFKVSKGLSPRDYVGPITLAELRKDPGNRVAPPSAADEPIWLRHARQEIGVTEIAGKQHSKRILSYWELAKLPFRDDETPWCAGFVNAMLEDVDIKGTRSGMARSFERWGQPCGPLKGAVVVLWRGSKTSAYGHVGFLTGKDQYGNLMVLGGNQGDAVNIKPFLQARVVGYRWPSGFNLDGSPAEVVVSNGQVSTNEA